MSTAVRFPLRESPLLRNVRVPYVALLDGALMPDACDRLVRLIETHSPAVATINARGGPVLNTNVRNNDRVIFDDVALAGELFSLTRAGLPTTFDGGTLVGYNERFRGYRYLSGQRFAPHFDGAYYRPETPKGREGSQITVLFYLNDGFSGGETRILDYDVVIVPKKGSALLFEHPILHEGCAVTSGVKYVLRTDAMYWFERS